MMHDATRFPTISLRRSVTPSLVEFGSPYALPYVASFVAGLAALRCTTDFPRVQGFPVSNKKIFEAGASGRAIGGSVGAIALALPNYDDD